MRVQCRDPSFISDVGTTLSQAVRSVVTDMGMKYGYLMILVLANDEICGGCEHGLHQQQVLVDLRHQGGHRAEPELRQARVLVPLGSLPARWSMPSQN